MWNEGLIVPMVESFKSDSLQLTDVGGSIVGNAINYPDRMDTKLFYTIRKKTVNVPDRASKLGVNTQAQKKHRSMNYKNQSHTPIHAGEFPRKWIILR